MNLDERIRTIHREGRKNHIDFEERCKQVNQIVEEIANEAKKLGFGAKLESFKEHFQFYRHHEILYCKCFVPIDPEGNAIGNEIFASENHAIAFGFELFTRITKSHSDEA